MKIKTKKSWQDKFPDNVSRRNLDTMKLLVNWDKFQSDVEKIRNEFNIPLEEGFKGEGEGNWWHELCKKSDDFFNTEYYLTKRKRLLFLRKKSYIEFLREQENLNLEIPINRFRRRLDEITTKYKLPYNFKEHIERYVMCSKISAPSTNFVVAFDLEERKWEFQKSWKEKIKWLSIRAYAPLTEKEIRFATKELRDHQKHYLPSTVTKDIRVHTDIDKAIAIEKEMDKRIRKTEEKPTDGYLEDVKRIYGEKKYKETIKLWLEQGKKPLKKEVIKYTSKEIAKKFFRSTKKANLVRQIYLRIKKERLKRFGEVV